MHAVRRKRRGPRKARSGWERERVKERGTNDEESAGKMCNKRIAGQRSRTGPGLFEDDLKISLYEA